MATWGSFLFAVWRRETTAVAVETLAARLGQLAADVGHEVGIVVIIEEGAAGLTPQVRQLMTRRLQSAPLGVCVLAVEARGFQAAALRAIITGVGLLARPPFPYRAFASVEDAAKWLVRQERAGLPSVPAEALERAVRRVRAASPIESTG
jgi:hypothetical protein